MYFVQVILPLSLSKTFTYSISEAEFSFVKIGMRVAVPFGKNKIYTGLISDIHQQEPELYEAKEIHQILDHQPVVTELQLKHWNWMASYYMCPIGDVFRGAMPSSLLLESETMVKAITDTSVDHSTLSDDEFLIIAALQQQSSLKVRDVMSILNKKTIFPVIRRMMERGLLNLEEEINETYKPKLISYVRIAKQFSDTAQLSELLESLTRSAKQRKVVMTYFQLQATSTKPIPLKELSAASDVTQNVVKSLIDKDILEKYQIAEDRVIFDDIQSASPTLSIEQNRAFNDIVSSFKSQDVCLLHGVTSSGKTEIYISLIEKYLESGQQVLYLLPEIALTTQLVHRLTKHFGNKVSVFHSKYTNNERVEVWNNVLLRSLSAQVVIGARSALFLPFADLKLIIIDEEHEQMFKQQDPAPRYHARDAAIVLAKFSGAKVLLGSATPAIETYYNVSQGKYAMTEIFERYGNVQMPEIILVDLKDKYFRKKMNGHFSDTLVEAMATALQNGEQIILFQNRRGYSPQMECMTCGHVPQCRQCDVSLTFHKHKSQLRCHYCGYSIAKPAHCHACGSIDLTTKGFGTEQVQLEVSALFPDAKVGRMDHDTTRGKFGFDKIIDSFKNRETDILVGTQMLAKGLDFDNVGLVGIMNADNMLYHPDFRAFERSYQMIAQVSGRAGRSGKQGKVMIQTYNPHHNTILQVTHNDYIGMYKEQLYERQIYKYPPFFKLIRLTLRHRDFEILKQGSVWLYQVLTDNLQMPVLGPEEPPISRIRNEYIRTIMIKIPPQMPLEGTKKTIRRILDSFESVAQYRSVKVTINVDVY